MREFVCTCTHITVYHAPSFASSVFNNHTHHAPDASKRLELSSRRGCILCGRCLALEHWHLVVACNAHDVKNQKIIKQTAPPSPLSLCLFVSLSLSFSLSLARDLSTHVNVPCAPSLRTNTACTCDLPLHPIHIFGWGTFRSCPDKQQPLYVHKSTGSACTQHSHIP